MGLFSRKLEKKYVPIENHFAREDQWRDFIRLCESFDCVEFKNGGAVGYWKNEASGMERGTKLLIPFQMITWCEEF